MGVLARKCRKALLLTGTLMGGYADDLFHLLWRLNPRMMIEDGFAYSAQGSLGPAQMAFMREHGVVKDIYKESESSRPVPPHGQGHAHRPSHRQGAGLRAEGHRPVRAADHGFPEAQGDRGQRRCRPMRRSRRWR